MTTFARPAPPPTSTDSASHPTDGTATADTAGSARGAHDALTADLALKAAHRAMWATGDYPRLARDLVAPLGPALVAALGVSAGEGVHDVACGSGNAALAAARVGAEVTASDLTPELVDAGRALAEAEGLTLRWRTADVEHLPCDDGQFDVVTSCIGVMFAPHHALAAAELVRICRPGGRIGILAWTPGGFIGRMFAVMRPFAPPPPPGASPPPLWGDEAYVRELLGSGVTDVVSRVATLRVTRFETPQQFREYFAATYGPTIAVRAYAGRQGRGDELDAALDALAADALAADGRTGGGDEAGMDWEYRILTARRAGG